MPAALLPDTLWSIIEPLLPRVPARPRGGRPPVPARAALTGILFVLGTGIPWERLPQEMGCGSGVICWRRLRDWQAAGVWDRLHRELLRRLRNADRIDWSRACLDSSSIAAKGGGDATGPNPMDRGRPGTKRHLITDRRGVPLAFLLTGANVPFEALIDAVPAVTGKQGRPRRRPDKLHADKAYDARRCRQACRRRGIRHRIARRGVKSSEKLGRHRWVIERSVAWINRFRRLVVRYERRADIHHAFTSLACSLICLRRLQGRL